MRTPIMNGMPLWVKVDYPTYKELMTDHGVASRTYHGTEPGLLGMLAVDSIRSNLLRALKKRHRNH